MNFLDFAWSDVVSCYRFLLGREPESEAVVKEKLPQPKQMMLASFFLSDEFAENVAGRLLKGESLRGEVFERAPAPHSKVWIICFLPLTQDGQTAVRRTKTWAALFAAVFADLRFTEEIAPDGLHGADCAALSAAARAQIKPPPPFQGAMEWRGAEEMRGWAVALDAPDRRLELELAIDDHPVGAGTTGLYRPDLQARFGGDGCIGFSIAPAKGVAWPQGGQAVLRERGSGCVLDAFALAGRERLPVHAPEQVDDLSDIRACLSRVERQMAVVSEELESALQVSA